MAMSGITVDDEVKKAFDKLKLKPDCRYIQMKITEDKTRVEIEKKGDISESYDDFVNQLPRDDCRFVVLDYNPNKGGDKGVLVFISWIPDEARVAKKMVYASTNDTIKKQCDTNHYVQANDLGDLAESAIAEKTKSKV